VGCLAIGILTSLAAAGAAAAPSRLLPEGTVLQGVDGTIVRADSNEIWLFELSEDVNDAGVQVPAGTRLELLPSATLEQIIADANERLLPQYRLTAQVTRYQGANFLFASYYLPLSKFKDVNEPAQRQNAQGTTDTTQAGAGRSSGALAIPPEVLEKLKGRHPMRGPQRQGAATGAAVSGSIPTRMLANVDGFIQLHEDRWYFVPDALGWNVSAIRYELLPSRVLEQAQRRMAASPNPIRFSVAGLVTGYKGREYLLLQRAARVYNYGNFGG
jgi:hypothetical protein